MKKWPRCMTYRKLIIDETEWEWNQGSIYVKNIFTN